MAKYITIPTRVGDRTFDLDKPIVWKDANFSRTQALEELAQLDERCYPVLSPVSSEEWVLLVHAQVQPHERVDC